MSRGLRGRRAASAPGGGWRGGARRVAAFALLLAAWRSPVALAAEPARGSGAALTPSLVHLDYRRNPNAGSCVSAAQLTRDVEARLGRRVFAAPAEADLTAHVQARRVGRRFVVGLELFDRDQRSLGRRELSTHARHCSALDDSLALVLALAADMPRAPAPVVESTPPAPAAPPVSAPAPTQTLGTSLSIPVTTYAPRLGVRFRPSLGAAVALGLVPSLAPGLELGLELRANQFWPVMLQAGGFLERDQAASIPAKAAFAAQTLLLGVCPWAAELGAFEGSLCAVQRLGRIQAQGVGFDEEQRDEGWSLHAGAAFGLTRTLGPLFVGASAALLVPVVRRRYFFLDGTEVTLYEQPWLGGLLALRVGTEI